MGYGLLWLLRHGWVKAATIRHYFSSGWHMCLKWRGYMISALKHWNSVLFSSMQQHPCLLRWCVFVHLSSLSSPLLWIGLQGIITLHSSIELVLLVSFHSHRNVVEHLLCAYPWMVYLQSPARMAGEFQLQEFQATNVRMRESWGPPPPK